MKKLIANTILLLCLLSVVIFNIKIESGFDHVVIASSIFIAYFAGKFRMGVKK